MNDGKKPKVVHQYFSAEHINEVDDYINQLKKQGKKIQTVGHTVGMIILWMQWQITGKN